MPSGTKQRNSKPAPWGYRARLLALLLAIAATGTASAAPQHCVAAGVVLWGDGRHDDTKALNAWFGGTEAVWGDSGAPVGNEIAGHRFLLSSAVYAPGGTRREMEKFQMVWPKRGETVTGGSIVTGNDPDKPPLIAGVKIAGGDAGEGKPFEAPDPTPPHPKPDAGCATS